MEHYRQLPYNASAKHVPKDFGGGADDETDRIGGAVIGGSRWVAGDHPQVLSPSGSRLAPQAPETACESRGSPKNPAELAVSQCRGRKASPNLSQPQHTRLRIFTSSPFDTRPTTGTSRRSFSSFLLFFHLPSTTHTTHHNERPAGRHDGAPERFVIFFLLSNFQFRQATWR